MISYKEALNIVCDNAYDFESYSVPISESIGMVLAQDVNAFRDMPPFDRVAMDGIAINYQDAQSNTSNFPCESIQAAGQEVNTLSNNQSCIEVMTGAHLPHNTDTVIPFEHLKKDGRSYSIVNEIRQGSNIHRKGKDLEKGQTVINKWDRIESGHIAILASEGFSKVPVFKYPSIAIISTGDELVPIDNTPQPFQIRSSNSHMLKSALTKLGVESSIFHISDDKFKLEQELKQLIHSYDVLMLSGGVSKGKYDYVPEVLNNLGVNQSFHRVKQRPGKPFWYGTFDKKSIFAFPGNPASALTCFKAYFEPWLLTCLRQKTSNHQVKLEKEFVFKPNLTYFAPAKISIRSNERMARIEKGNGSGDLANLTKIDGFVVLPGDQEIFTKGSLFDFIKL